LGGPKTLALSAFLKAILMTDRSSEFLSENVSTRMTDFAPTAADAAVLQHAEGVSLKRSGELFRHPAAALYDDVFAAVLSAVPTIAARKHVPLGARDDEAVLRHALRSLSRKTLRGILRGDAKAVRTVQDAIDYSLDVLATTRLIELRHAIEGTPLPITFIREAEEALRPRFANDRATMRVWPDAVTMLADHVHAELAMEKAPATVTLPDAATIRCTVRLPGGTA
jgi:hypothetical protein